MKVNLLCDSCSYSQDSVYLPSDEFIPVKETDRSAVSLGFCDTCVGVKQIFVGLPEPVLISELSWGWRGFSEVDARAEIASLEERKGRGVLTWWKLRTKKKTLSIYLLAKVVAEELTRERKEAYGPKRPSKCLTCGGQDIHLFRPDCTGLNLIAHSCGGTIRVQKVQEPHTGTNDLRPNGQVRFYDGFGLVIANNE